MANTKKIKAYTAGCLTRRAGKVYAWTNLEDHLDRYPFSYFVYDPPIWVPDPKSWGLCAQGISWMEQGDVWHANDWVGENNYPNTADILEELLNGWCSGLVPLTSNINRIDPFGRSNRVLYHPKGHLHNPQPYKENRVNLQWEDCFLPEGDAHDEHVNNPDLHCASLHWQYVEGGTSFISDNGRKVRREIGEHTYEAAKPIEDHPPELDLAAVCWLPIDELHLVASDDAEVMEKAVDTLQANSRIPWFITEN